MRDWAWKHSLAIIRVPKGEQMVAGRKENKNKNLLCVHFNVQAEQHVQNDPKIKDYSFQQKSHDNPGAGGVECVFVCVCVGKQNNVYIQCGCM